MIIDKNEAAFGVLGPTFSGATTVGDGLDRNVLLKMVTPLKLPKGQYSLVEECVAPSAQAGGKSLGDLDLPAECTLAAIIRHEL